METEKKTNGAIIGLIVIVIILMIGAFYIWQSKVKEMETLKAQNAAALEQQANIIKSLEQNLKGTNTSIDANGNIVN